MKRVLVVGIMLGLVLPWSTALAVKKGEKLFIKARNTKVMASTQATAQVLAVLQPGDTVIWQGADAKNKQWHMVEVEGKKGVVFKSNLGTQPPSMEVVAGKGGPVDSRAFASSGAATKALGENTKKYAAQKSMGESAEDLVVQETLSLAVAPKDIADYAKKAGLYPVVGASDE